MKIIFDKNKLPSDMRGYTHIDKATVGIADWQKSGERLDTIIHELLEVFVTQNRWRWEGGHEQLSGIATFLGIALTKLGCKIDRLPKEIEV